MNSIEHFLSSRKLSLALLAGFLLLCIAGTLVPQEGVDSFRTVKLWRDAHPRLASLEATHIFSSWYFSAVVACIFVNITFSTGRLIRRMRRPSKETATPNAESVFLMKSKTCVPAIVNAGALRQALPFTRISTSADGTILRGERFRFARWAVVVFHLSLLLIIGGVFLNRAMFYRAVYSLVERDYFIAGKDRPASGEQGFLASGGLLPIKVTLAAVQDGYAEAGYQPSLASEIGAESATEKKDFLVTRAAPVHFNGITIYQSPEFGYAPVFSKLSPDGSAATGTIRMLKQKGDGDASSAAYRGSGMVPGSDLRLECSCTTIPVSAGIPGQITVSFLTAEGLFTRSEMSAGSEVRVGRDIIRLEGIMFWTNLIVSQQPWTLLLYLGFTVAFLSLLTFALFQPCVIWCFIDGRRGTTTIAVSCVRFKSSEDAILRMLMEKIDASRGSPGERAGLTLA